MGTLISYAVVLAYAGVFVWQCCKYRVYGWLFISLVLWIVLAAMSSLVLPGIAGLFKPLNLFLMPVYILLSSCFALYRRDSLKQSAYLTTLLYGCWLQFSALVVCWVLVLVLCLVKNVILLIPLLVSLFQMFLWQPVFWIGSQWIIMLLLFLRSTDTEKPFWSVRTVLFFCLFEQLLYLMMNFRGKL